MYKVYDNSGMGSIGKNEHKNLTVYSALTSFEMALPFNNFAIKYVMNGMEKYTVNGQDFLVHGGEYLLCNPASEGKIYVDSKKDVEGICIDLSVEILSEAIASHCRPDSPMADAGLDKFFRSGNFLESKYSSRNTKLGNLLTQVHHCIGSNPEKDHEFTHEFYFNLAQHVVMDCIPLYNQLQSIPSIKLSTKKDLFGRLSKGKDFMDAHYTTDIYIEKIAHESCMSQFHFYRLFKNVYGLSPYQYIKEKRLNLAKENIEQGKASITEIAAQVGYADLFSFSKAYKQYFGKSPSVRG
jgi:AraC family transcriptional regulator